LAVTHAADLASLCQAIARRYLDRRPRLNTSLQYDTYTINRFKAAKSAWDAAIVDVEADRTMSLADSAASLVDRCLPYCTGSGAIERLERLRRRIQARVTDADWMREVIGRNCDWVQLMMAQSHRLFEPAGAVA
jgi:gamma-glutamyl:cysteine ligase YbdK (ATP-grasp superfamily)